MFMPTTLAVKVVAATERTNACGAKPNDRITIHIMALAHEIKMNILLTAMTTQPDKLLIAFEAFSRRPLLIIEANGAPHRQTLLRRS